MKKFLSSVLAVLLLIVCLSIPAFADAQLSYVTDDAGILYDSDISALEERAAAVSEQYGCACTSSRSRTSRIIPTPTMWTISERSCLAATT